MKNQALDSTAFVRSAVAIVSTFVPSSPFVTRTLGMVQWFHHLLSWCLAIAHRGEIALLLI
jgi:hypothetical protein